jgi:hypothetical protein
MFLLQIYTRKEIFLDEVGKSPRRTVSSDGSSNSELLVKQTRWMPTASTSIPTTIGLDYSHGACMAEISTT